MLCIFFEESAAVDIRIGDILIMKKEHPGCGNNRMKVTKAGTDFKLSCLGCGHLIIIPRFKCEKNVKSVIREETDEKL